MTITKQPDLLQLIIERAEQLNFTMSCDLETGQFLRMLAASKPNGVFLELGTGAGTIYHDGWRSVHRGTEGQGV